MAVYRVITALEWRSPAHPRVGDSVRKELRMPRETSRSHDHAAGKRGPWKARPEGDVAAREVRQSTE